MDPGLESSVPERGPDGFFILAAHADPERSMGLQSGQEVEPAHLGSGRARRHGKLVPDPGGKQPPGIGIDGPSRHPSLQSFGATVQLGASPTGTRPLGLAAGP